MALPGNEYLFATLRGYGLLGKVSREWKIKRADSIALITIYIRMEIMKELAIDRKSLNNIFFSFSQVSALKSLKRLEVAGLLRRSTADLEGRKAYELTPEGLRLVNRFKYLYGYSIRTDKYRKGKLKGRFTRDIQPPSKEGFFLDDPLSKILPNSSDPGTNSPTHPDAYTLDKFGPEATAKAQEYEDQDTPPQLKGWQPIVNK